MELDEHAVLFVVGEAAVARLGAHPSRVCRYDARVESDALGVDGVVAVATHHLRDPMRVRAEMVAAGIADQSTARRPRIVA